MLDRMMMATQGLVLPKPYDAGATHEYEEAVASYFGSGQAFAFWKGRVALYAILKALGVAPGDEVIVPGYTCVMVAGPVLYCGARPVYADIDADTCNLRVDEVRRLLSGRTKAVLVQHTYGIPAEIEEICRVASAAGVPVVEDCCHTFGGRLRGRLLGTFGKAAFFSGQWNKPFSTGLGGMALVHDAALAERVRAEQAALPSQSRKTVSMLAAQLLAYELLVRPSVTALVTRLFRSLTKMGLVVGSSGKQEFGATLPANYASRACAVQCRIGCREVARIDGNIAGRRAAAERYAAELPPLGYRLPRFPDGEIPMLLRFPVRVANKQEALETAARYSVEIGSWFECPLHPQETDQSLFGYSDGQCPVAERAAREVINLPTHRRVSASDLARTVAFLRSVCRPATGN
jgi:dTDP-4-amino-4,6-dideoxygalactose transaminase